MLKRGGGHEAVINDLCVIAESLPMMELLFAIVKYDCPIICRIQF